MTTQITDRDTPVTSCETECTMTAVEKAAKAVQKERSEKLVADLTTILGSVEQVQYDRKIGIEKRQKEIADREANIQTTSEAKQKLVDAVNSGAVATRYELQRFLNQNPEVAKALTSVAVNIAAKFEG